MRLSLIEAASIAGNLARPNDDAYCMHERCAAVLDGATGLGEPLLSGPSDAAWVATCGAERLAHHAAEFHGRDLLRAVLADVEASFLRERIRAPAAIYEQPMASLMMVQPASADTLATFWFGDCAALVQRSGGTVEVVGDTFSRKADESEGASALAAAHGVRPAGNLNRPEFLAALRASRNGYNTGEGPWTFAPDVRCAEHASEAAVEAPVGTVVLLASDGFLALATDYGRYDAAGLMARCAGARARQRHGRAAGRRGRGS
jgi:hypothetical protein